MTKNSKKIRSCAKSTLCEEKFFGFLENNGSPELQEAYNNLSSNVIHLPIDDKCKKIAITSSIYGEGKTSLSINLSISLAQNLIDKKILLVDADMHCPHIKKFISSVAVVEEGTELSFFLSGTEKNFSFGKSHIKNLDIVFSEVAQITPTGLINSSRMNEFISLCEEKYDYIIIDTPPANYFADAASFVNIVNGYIISTKSRTSKIPMISSTADALTSVGATILGVVLTK